MPPEEPETTEEVWSPQLMVAVKSEATALGLSSEKLATVKDVAAPPKTSTAVAPPRSYALIIGVGKYQNLSEKQNLLYSERDADSLYSILISPEGGNFRAENVHKLAGSRATLANVRRELEQWLPGAAKEDDRVLIYFAGHGFVFGGSTGTV